MTDKALQVVFDDLEYLKENWNDDKITDRDLRISSTILRRLFIEGMLYQAMRSMQVKIQMQSSEVNLLPDAIYQRGGGTRNGVTLEHSTFYNRSLTDTEFKTVTSGALQTKNVKIQAFMLQKTMSLENIEINREELIKYVNHKIGGAHHDEKRDSKDLLEKKYILLDKYSEEYRVIESNPIYFELLSFGQTIINTSDVNVLIEKMKKHLEKNKPKRLEIKKN